MNIFQKIFSGIGHLFTTPKAQIVAQQIEAVADKALPVIAQIEQLTGGNKTLNAVIAAYNHYGKPAVEAEAHGANLGAALMNLAVSVLSEQFPGVPWSTIQTGAQLAFSAFKASKT
jgi:hypothetical protein